MLFWLSSAFQIIFIAFLICSCYNCLNILELLFVLPNIFMILICCFSIMQLELFDCSKMLLLSFSNWQTFLLKVFTILSLIFKPWIQLSYSLKILIAIFGIHYFISSLERSSNCLIFTKILSLSFATDKIFPNTSY